MLSSLLFITENPIFKATMNAIGEIMCKCNCETTETKRTPQPGEVWLGYDCLNNRIFCRRLVLGIYNDEYLYINISDTDNRLYKTKKTGVNAPDLLNKLDSDQSHNIQLPNQASKPLQLEIGKVYENDNGLLRILIIDTHQRLESGQLVAIGIALNSYRIAGVGVGHRRIYNLDGSRVKEALVRLSTNQSREIVL